MKYNNLKNQLGKFELPRVDAVTLKQLRALVAVSQAQSLTGGAAILGQSAPTIHSQIKNLEAAIGKPLFLRPSEGEAFSLTPEGEELFAAAERIEAVLSQSTARIRALGQGLRGHVTLGTVSTAKYFAPALVRVLRDRCPEIEVDLRIANRETTLDDMRRGVFDLVIMGRPPRAELNHATPLGPHPHGVILPPDHPLATTDGFDPEALMGETFLSREMGSGTRILMERYLQGLTDGQPTRLLTLDSNETIKQSVIAGLGIAFLSLHTVIEELRTGRLALLRGPNMPIMRHWYLVVPGELAPTASARRIADEIVGLNGVYLPKLPVTG